MDLFVCMFKQMNGAVKWPFFSNVIVINGGQLGCCQDSVEKAKIVKISI